MERLHLRFVAAGNDRLAHHQHRHCEPTGPHKARPDDRLREAIQSPARDFWIASAFALRASADKSARSAMQ
jgi:hypothetical protein